MRLEVRHLRAFHTVAEELSFRRASQRLGIAQPALSRTIQDLEAIVRVRLFERTTRVVGLTEPGKAFLKRTQNLLLSLEEAVHFARKVDGGAASELQVAYNDFAINGLLPEIVREFRISHPSVEVNLWDPTTPEMIESVLDKKFDVVFHMNAHQHPELDHIVVRDERLVCILPASHECAKERSVSLTRLSDEPFVMGRWNSWKVYRRVIESFCETHGFTPTVIQEAVHSDGIMGLVAAEMGVTLYVDTEWIHSIRGVAVRPLKGQTPRIETVATWRRAHRTAGSALSAFLDAIENVVNQRGVRFQVTQ